jgi:[acyl-carrier-protein] S-malonyltransferase
MTRAFVFPGQGSQQVGMGQELAGAFSTARLVFEEVDEALSMKLSRLMFEGPEDELTLTENAQPALMATSIAVLRVLEAEGGFKLPAACHFVAGHSLGEYSALAAAGAISLGEAARILRARGAAMQRAVPVGVGAMAALLGLELDVALSVVEDAQKGEDSTAGSDDGICAAANDNAPGQVVISGDKAAVERAVALASERGAKRAIMLDVSAPFHCSLMQPAADEMAELLAAVSIVPPVVPVISNVSARAESDPETVRQLLVEQITNMVRWRECVEFLRGQGVETLVELGSGKVLTGLARRIDRDLTGIAVNAPADVEAALKTF